MNQLDPDIKLHYTIPVMVSCDFDGVEFSSALGQLGVGVMDSHKVCKVNLDLKRKSCGMNVTKCKVLGG